MSKLGPLSERAIILAPGGRDSQIATLILKEAGFDAAGGVDARGPHVRKVDHEPVVAHGIAGDVVPAAADGERPEASGARPIRTICAFTARGRRTVWKCTWRPCTS